MRTVLNFIIKTRVTFQTSLFIIFIQFNKLAYLLNAYVTQTLPNIVAYSCEARIAAATIIIRIILNYYKARAYHEVISFYILKHCCPTKNWLYSWFGTDFLLIGNSPKQHFTRSSEPWRTITQFFTH